MHHACRREDAPCGAREKPVADSSSSHAWGERRLPVRLTRERASCQCSSRPSSLVVSAGAVAARVYVPCSSCSPGFASPAVPSVSSDRVAVYGSSTARRWSWSSTWTAARVGPDACRRRTGNAVRHGPGHHVGSRTGEAPAMTVPVRRGYDEVAVVATGSAVSWMASRTPHVVGRCH